MKPPVRRALMAFIDPDLVRGFWPAAVLMIPCVAIFLRRTGLEARFLRESLDGYVESADCVRYRLVPGMW